MTFDLRSTSIENPSGFIGPPPRTPKINYFTTIILGIFTFIYVMYFCFCLYFAGTVFREFLIFKQLQSSGAYTKGTIIDSQVKRVSKSTLYIIKYQFIANGQTVTRRAKVTYDYFANAIPAHAVSVHYMPEDPSINRLDGEPGRGFNVVVIFLLLILYSNVLFPYLALLRKEFSLARQGLIGKGKMTSQVRIRNFLQLSYVQVTYEFQDSCGRSYEGLQRKSSFNKDIEIGKNIQILYDSAQPQLNCCYPMIYFRLV
jgi:hypothetical protein